MVHLDWTSVVGWGAIRAIATPRDATTLMMLTLSALLALLGAASAARTFTDDAGTTHTIDDAKVPTFITDVQDALSLVHFGVHHDQVHATFGTRFQSGSNGRLDGTPQYADGNLATFGVDHNVADYDPSLFPVDPNAAEMAALAQAPNLSPCTGGAYWCTDWDMTPANATAGTPDGHAKVIMDSIGWPDFLIEGAASPSYDYYHIKSAAVIAATPASTKVIVITRADPCRPGRGPAGEPRRAKLDRPDRGREGSRSGLRRRARSCTRRSAPS